MVGCGNDVEVEDSPEVICSLWFADPWVRGQVRLVIMILCICEINNNSLH